MKTMKGARYDVRESDPFAREHIFSPLAQGSVPIVGRIQALWVSLRDAAMENFPPAPGLPENKAAYLRFVDEICQSDAYHSLSIEGYRVTPELIERVGTGNWNPDACEADRQNRDALAARGYWQAFQQVKEAVAKIIAGSAPAPWCVPRIAIGIENCSRRALRPSVDGHPWTVIRVEDRAAYLKALESASIDRDIRPFAPFIAERVRW
jgi:hypothetical protein